VTGDWIKAEEAVSPNYWARHLRQTVRFSDGLGKLLKTTDRVLLEVGPGPSLCTLAKQHPDRTPGQVELQSLPRPNEKVSDLEFLLKTTGRLWMAGVEIDWDRMHEGKRRRRVVLPTYPFERKRYWVTPRKSTPGDFDLGKRAQKRSDISEWFYVPSWKQSPLPATKSDEMER